MEYLIRCVDTAIKAGATTINLPDTVGYATPDEYLLVGIVAPPFVKNPRIGPRIRLEFSAFEHLVWR